MGIPEPAPSHSGLQPFAGRWEGVDTMHPSDWDPMGGEARGFRHHRMGLGGFVLISDYRQERDGEVTFSGHGVFSYDGSAGRYVLHWFDSMGGQPEVFTGTLSGKRLVLTHGGRMHVRVTLDAEEPGLLQTSLEMSSDGESWKRLMDGRYRSV